MSSKPENSRNRRGPDKGKGRRVAIMVSGILAFCIGLAMMLVSFRTNAAQFNTGLMLFVAGVIATIAAAVTTDRKRPNGKPNGRA